MALPPPKPPTEMSTGAKIALGGLGLGLLGGLFAALGGQKTKPLSKPGLGKPSCGPCGR